MDDPDHIKLMLEILYTQCYSLIKHDLSPQSTPEYRRSIPETHISLYVIGDKYDISMLCKHATNRLQSMLNSTSELMDVLAFIPLLYNTLPKHNRTLRTLVIQAIFELRTEKDWDESTENAFLENMDEHKGFRDDIALAFLKF